MFGKTVKKVVSGILAISATVACVGTISACETSHPKVAITLEFQNEEYVLEYKLYRNIASSTVKHFLALVDAEYYDGVCIHDYDGEDAMYTGGYTYTAGADNGGLVGKNYYEIAPTVENFSHSVWFDEAQTKPTYTLYGEFSDNDYKVTNGAVQESFGALSMYYTEKDCEDTVWVKRGDGNGVSEKKYGYNSATSMFSISLASTSSVNAKYCTFATLEEDSADELKALQQAVKDYAGEDEFTTDYTVRVDEDDAFIGEHNETATYAVPDAPIVIKTIKIKKI